MSERIQTGAIPLLGRLAPREQDADRATALEREVVALFDEMRPRILGYALGFGLPAPDAEEVVQDVFMALYQHLANGKSRHALCGWLFRVTRNLSVRRRAPIGGTSAVPIKSYVEDDPRRLADPDPNPEDQFAFRERQGRLRSVVEALPQMDRECLYLRAEGFRYREIAEVMGISLGSVANSLARSLSRLSAAAERLG